MMQFSLNYVIEENTFFAINAATRRNDPFPFPQNLKKEFYKEKEKIDFRQQSHSRPSRISAQEERLPVYNAHSLSPLQRILAHKEGYRVLDGNGISFSAHSRCRR